ncbi:MAG: adenosylcobalamin-dependent ribonucleoside-diphosphate reductase [Candidatus Dojkabacteria bacterium]|nr:adenosylcobalamin-dependent ribonucleoside-diphosphate reductase [Candidatus Dojkabacteria bacterium]
MPRRFYIEPKLNEKQQLIANSRYLLKDSHGKVKETARDMFIRISKLIASAEKRFHTTPKEVKMLEDDFYQMQASLEFLSGTPMHDRGLKRLMAECYVLPLEDSLESIYHTLYYSVQLHRLGAGIGYDFSKLRPEGSTVHSTGKEASGPISFMRLFDFSSEIILNRGSARHAGHMGILRIDHPDIEKFIKAKEDYSQLTNFNLSVAITDSFMRAYKTGSHVSLRDPSSGQVASKVDAKYLMELIAKSVHQSAEPGIIFIDEINRKNTVPGVGRISATNLCGEQPLLPFEACYLGGITLNKFYEKNSKEGIKWKRLAEVTRLAVRYLDNMIELGYNVLPEIQKINVEGNRKIGIGVLGWADLLAELRIPYDSDKGVKLAEKIMRFIQNNARDESSKLGRIRGNFANFKKSLFYKRGFKNMRNATVTTIAPTGTRSLFADCNSGVEPFFALAYSRENMETLDNQKIYFVNESLEKALKEEWLFSKKLMREVSASGSISNIEDIPDKIKRIFRTTYEIAPEWHLKMQAAFQKYTDNAVSKTLNVKESTTEKEIESVYLEAHSLKLKGVTIYRDKSRDKQVLNVTSSQKKQNKIT